MAGLVAFRTRDAPAKQTFASRVLQFTLEDPVSQLLIMIATAVVAFLLGRLTARPLIRRLRQALADAAWWLSHDQLTGMLNRTGFYAAHTALAAMSRPVVILLIDLDCFKPVNDTHGHDTGDNLLSRSVTASAKPPKLSAGPPPACPVTSSPSCCPSETTTTPAPPPCFSTLLPSRSSWRPTTPRPP